MNAERALLLGWPYGWSDAYEIITVSPGLRRHLPDEGWCELVRALALTDSHLVGDLHREGVRGKLMFAAEAVPAPADAVLEPDPDLNEDLDDFWALVARVVLRDEDQWGTGDDGKALFPEDKQRALGLLGGLVDKAPEAVPEWLHGPVEGERSFRDRLVQRLALLRAKQAAAPLR